MIVFGGYAGRILNDVWGLSLSGSPTWFTLAPAGRPPSARYDHTAIYDPLRDRMLVFGGNDAGYHFLYDAWALSLVDTMAWSLIVPVRMRPMPAGHTTIYDPVRDRMLVFGGFDAGYFQNYVWALSLGETPAWRQIVPAGTPPTPRRQHTAIYDPVRDRMLVFGGEGNNFGGLNDIWALSLGDTPAWSLVAPLGTPPPERYGHTAIYDPLRDRMVVFGGAAATTSGHCRSGTRQRGARSYPRARRRHRASNTPRSTTRCGAAWSCSGAESGRYRSRTSRCGARSCQRGRRPPRALHSRRFTIRCATA